MVFIIVNFFITNAEIRELENPVIWLPNIFISNTDMDFLIRRYDIIVFILLFFWSVVKKGKINPIGVIIFHGIMFLVIIINLEKYYALIL